MQRLSAVVVHGSFSEVYAQEFQVLLKRVGDRLNHPVLGAYLECTDLSLTEQITAFVQTHLSTENLVVQILPLFLLAGVHVREDIPEAIEPLQKCFPQVQFKILDYLGKDGLLAPFLEPQFAKYPTANRVLITHGSRRAGANSEIKKLAQILNANIAYWANEPFLAQIIEQISSENKPVCVVPYFLFSGKIPAAIANQIIEFSQTYPNIQFYLGKPFGTEPECATAIANQLLRI